MMIQIPNKLPPTTPNITGNTDELLVIGGMVLAVAIALVFVITVTLFSARMVVELLVASDVTVMIGADSILVAVGRSITVLS